MKGSADERPDTGCLKTIIVIPLIAFVIVTGALNYFSKREYRVTTVLSATDVETLRSPDWVEFVGLDSTKTGGYFENKGRSLADAVSITKTLRIVGSRKEARIFSKELLRGVTGDSEGHLGFEGGDADLRLRFQRGLSQVDMLLSLDVHVMWIFHPGSDRAQHFFIVDPIPLVDVVHRLFPDDSIFENEWREMVEEPRKQLAHQERARKKGVRPY